MNIINELNGNSCLFKELNSKEAFYDRNTLYIKTIPRRFDDGSIINALNLITGEVVRYFENASVTPVVADIVVRKYKC